MDCKVRVKARQNSGKGADCKEEVKEEGRIGKVDFCEVCVKRRQNFGKENFYENEVKRQEKSGKAASAGQGRKITRGGQPATRANASKQPASECEQLRQAPEGKKLVTTRERMRAGSARRENDNRRRK